MCWACDNPDKTHQDYLDYVRAMIRDWGWMVQTVEGDRLHPPWAYTVGLTSLGAPELLVTGLSQQPAYDLLRDLTLGVLHGTMLPTGTTTVRLGRTVQFLHVEVPDAHLHIAVDIYGPQIRATQVVWQDDRGKWPWEPGHRAGRGGQPILGVPDRVAR
jgi:hypothetical protein